MQEVKNVIMESTDGLEIPVVEEETTSSPQEPALSEKTFTSLQPNSEVEEVEDETNLNNWRHQDDTTDGLASREDSPDETYSEIWRARKSKSNGHSRTNIRRRTSDEEVEEEKINRQDWSWTKRPGSRSSVEDDGLLERGRRSQSTSLSYPYQREDDFRRERRSLSRQPDRIFRREESPRSAFKRDRSTSRAPEIEDTPSSRLFSRTEQHRSFPAHETSRRERSPKRERSMSRTLDYEVPHPEEEWLSRRSVSREFEPTELLPRPLMNFKTEPPKLLSSGSESEPEPEKPSKTPRRRTLVPRVSDEEDWEQELRLRRRNFIERLASEERESKNSEEGNIDSWTSVRRRSSAEGKIALLKDPTGSNVMDSWTVSRGPRVSLLGSSQDTEDDNSYALSQKEYREMRRESSLKEDERSEEDSSMGRSRRHSFTSGSQVTSVEEEDEIANNDFVLKKDSKMITVMDLSKLSQEEQESEGISGDWKHFNDNEGIDDGQPKMATLKLFKRESIVKSQASEEDPEYMLPERPKLMEQEQDHPFKKAWQLQKSRSEEDGPSAYALKEVKTQNDPARIRVKDKENKHNKNKENSEQSSSGEQAISECSVDNDDDVNVTTVSPSGSEDVEDSRSGSKSEVEMDSAKVDWPSEDEHFKLRRRRESEETNWVWELDDP